MLDLICLWIGRIIVGILFLIACAFVLKALSVPLRKPWYFIKHLMPWKWVTEKQWQEYETACRIAQTEKNPPEWKIGAYTRRKGRLGILTFPNDKKWWSPKNHLFFIKKG